MMVYQASGLFCLDSCNQHLQRQVGRKSNDSFQFIVICNLEGCVITVQITKSIF